MQQQTTAQDNRSMVRHRLLAVAAILLFAFGLRYNYNDFSQVEDPLTADAAQYVAYALNLSRHHTFSKDRVNVPPKPDSYWAPGYPLLLAAMVKISNATGYSEYTLTLNTQVLLGCLTVLLTYLLGAMFLPGYWPLLPSLLVAASPHLVSMGNYLLTETLFTFVLLLSLYLTCAGQKRHSIKLLIAAGFSFAATYLVNPVSIFLAPLLAIIAQWNSGRVDKPDRAQALKVSCALLLPLVIVSTGWALRSNLIESPEGLGSSHRLLTNLIIGMHSDFHELWRSDPGNPENPATLDAALIGDSYRLFSQNLWEKFRREPLAMLHWYALGKPAQLWHWNILVGAGDIYIYSVSRSLYLESPLVLASYSLMKSAHNWLLASALLCLACTLGLRSFRHPVVLTLATSTVYISAVYIATQAEPRYSIPLRPEMYLLASYFIYRMTGFVAELKAGRQAADPPRGPM